MSNRDIIEGPAVVEYDGFLYYSEDNITITPDLKLRELTSSYFGPGDQRVTDKMFAVSFTPIGMMDNNKTKYFPFTVSDLGKLIAPAIDKPVVIWAANGNKLTLPAGVITGSPQLLLGVDKGPMGQMTISCLGDISKADGAADAHYKIESAAVAAHTLDWDKAPTPAYKCTITDGTTPIVLDGLNGFTFDVTAGFTPRACNRYGTVNYKLSTLNPVLTFAPAYQSESAILALLNIQGAGAAKLGGSHKLGQSLKVEPAEAGAKGITIDFADCIIKSGSMIFGRDDPRHGDYAIVPAYKTGNSLYTLTFPTWA